ncbi:hypothetical protein B0H11DRAFT_1951653 [Mycena galericulata]|nr:hypothetical protein B0H11DRAFT_1951653 [Mycena galericulata]
MQGTMEERSRKSVFKIDPGKLPYSQNLPEECAYPECCARRSVGGAPLSVCSGCRSVRFCSREHLALFWPLHRDFCKSQMKNHELVRKQQQQLAESRSELPELQYRIRLAQDWIELHRYILDSSRMWALHESKVPLNFRKHYFQFSLTYRPESDGNPSMAFSLDTAEIREHSQPGTPGAEALAPYMAIVERANAEEEQMNGYRGVFLCAYMIDCQHLWITSSHVSEKALPKIRPSGAPWFTYAQWCAARGLVFRVVGDASNPFWTPGLMNKQGRKWVWKMHAIPQLIQKGIELTPGMISLMGKPIVFP